MFNVVEKHQKLVKGIMITMAATFAVWGISGYFGMTGDDGYVAKVGGSRIYVQDIDSALDQNPQQGQDKMQVLFGLINRQLLLNLIQDNHMSVSTKELQNAIMAIPMFQTNGKFDVNKYEDFLKRRYTTSSKFEQDVQRQLLITTFIDFFKNSYFTSHLFQEKFITLLSRERNISQYVIDPKQFISKVNISESDISAYYQQNIAKYTIPEQVKLAYIQLSADKLANAVKISDAEIVKYLRDHPATGSSEQIDISHILFTVPATATVAQKNQIKAKAAQVLAQVTANPAKFAALAKQYSQDPGSAQNGGDLGYFGKGVMVKPFEEAAFKLKKDQISGLVETQYGFHILKLNGVKSNDMNSQKLIVKELLQKQKANQQLQKLTDQLNEVSYNKPDSLDPAAKVVGLSIQTSDWVVKGSKTGLFANPKTQQGVFSDDVVKNHHNSELIDSGDGNYIIARAISYMPAQQKKLAEVKGQLINVLRAQLASQMANQLGQQNLTSLQQGKLKLNFTGSENVTLLGQSKSIDPMAIKQIFAAPVTSFPAYTGALNQAGAFVIYRINSQNINKKLDTQNEQVIKQLANQYSMMTLGSYVASLRSQYNVTYKLDRIKGSDAGAAAANH